MTFMDSVTYYTQPAKSKYDETRRKNIEKLKAMNVSSPNESEEKSPSKEEKKRLKAEKKKNEPKYNAEKGIETMFRISLKNHITLSRIADDKANTLISVNAIILSIVLSALFPKLDSNPWLGLSRHEPHSGEYCHYHLGYPVYHSKDYARHGLQR